MGCQLRCQIANNHKKFNVTLTAVSYYNEVRKLYYSWNLSRHHWDCGVISILVASNKFHWYQKGCHQFLIPPNLANCSERLQKVSLEDS